MVFHFINRIKLSLIRYDTCFFSICLRTSYYIVPPDINWFEAIPKKIRDHLPIPKSNIGKIQINLKDLNLDWEVGFFKIKHSHTNTHTHTQSTRTSRSKGGGVLGNDEIQKNKVSFLYYYL